MACLGTFAQHCLFHFDEIADETVLSHNGAGPQARIGSNRTVFSDSCPFEVTKALDMSAARDGHTGTEHHIRVDRDVGCQLGIVTEEYGFRSPQSDPFAHPVIALIILPLRFCSRQFGPAVDARDFSRIGFHHGNSIAPRDGACRDIGQVIFTLRIVIADPIQQRPHVVRMRNDETGIAKVARPFVFRCILIFHHLRHPAIAIGNDAAILQWVIGAETEHRDLGPIVQRSDQFANGSRLDHRAIAKTHENVTSEPGQRFACL